MSIQRKQDRWNDKKGQISKSYKLNRSVVEAFVNACSHDNTSQSNKLTSLIMDYSISVERRNSIMYIRERYSSGNNYDKILLTQLENSLLKISDAFINSSIDDFKKEILHRPRFYIFNDVIDCTKHFSCNIELDEYIKNEDTELIKYLSDVFVRQLILFKLINEGEIMPCQLRNRFSTEIDINHKHGNSLFEVNFNLLPYESFMKT